MSTTPSPVPGPDQKNNGESWSGSGNSMNETQLDCIFAEVKKLRDTIVTKDTEISRLQREIHKLKSVLEKSELTRIPSISSYQQGGISPHPVKKCGVSGESWDECGSSRLRPPERFYKDFRTRQLIRAALSDNDFLKNLDPEQVRDIVDFMFPQAFAPGAFIIQEGEAGCHLYVSAEGQLEVLQDGRQLGILGPGKAFGELALLYNCKRTASVRAIAECKVWSLERRAFQMAMVKVGMRRLEDRLTFLKSVPLLRGLQSFLLARIADCLEVESYPPGTYIIREGAVGDTFFILSQGRVQVTMSKPVSPSEPCLLRELSRGDYFGEQALLKEDKRSANVIALPPGVECLTLDRESFIHLIGDLSEFQQHRKKSVSVTGSSSANPTSTTGENQMLNLTVPSLDPGDWPRTLSSNSMQKLPASDTMEKNPVEEIVTDEFFEENAEEVEKGERAKLSFEKLRLDDLEVIATLGVGGFGRVELVQVSYDANRVFALKCLPKVHILATQQQEHVFAERNIMRSCNSPFIARLYSTFKDSKCIYLLMEACLGGEVWTILRDKGSFDEDTTRFMAACVILAIEYLHSKDIVYRDLKPENLMLANNGYVKLVDFGFSKVVPSGQRTWTFCGTPEYVAPEVILNRGHDRLADFWTLGVLLFELLTGFPPWGPMSADAPISDGTDPLTTYNQILKGMESVAFPKNVSRGAISLIRRLCRQAPGERLGAQKGVRDVMSHRWFQGFDWDGIRHCRIKPPIKPRLRGPRDTSNFDKFELDIEDTPDDLTGWDEDF